MGDGEISLFNEDFVSLMPSLSLTLNVEPVTCELLRILTVKFQPECFIEITNGMF